MQSITNTKPMAIPAGRGADHHSPHGSGSHQSHTLAGLSPNRGSPAAGQVARVATMASASQYGATPTGSRPKRPNLGATGTNLSAPQAGTSRWIPACEVSGEAIAGGPYLEPVQGGATQPPSDESTQTFLRSLMDALNGADHWRSSLLGSPAQSLSQALAVHGFFSKVMNITVLCKQWASIAPLAGNQPANVEADRLIQRGRERVAQTDWVHGLHDLIRAVSVDPCNAVAVRELVSQAEKVSGRTLNIFGVIPNPTKFVEDNERLLQELLSGIRANDRLPGNVVRLERIRDVCRRMHDNCERWQSEASRIKVNDPNPHAVRITGDANLNAHSGNWSRALRQLTKALQLNPCYAPALRSILECTRALQQKIEQDIAEIPQDWQRIQRQYEVRDRMIEAWAGFGI